MERNATLHVMPSAINVTTGPGAEVFENKGEWLLSWIICSTWLESEFPPRYSFSGAVRLALFLVTLHWWWSIFGVIYREGGKHYGAYPRSALTETRFYPRPTQPQPHQIQRELFKAHLEMRHTTIPKYVSRIFMLIKCISISALIFVDSAYILYTRNTTVMIRQLWFGYRCW